MKDRKFILDQIKMIEDDAKQESISEYEKGFKEALNWVLRK